MAVTIYRSTDAGAPALPANVNYLSANFYIDVVRACLVDGYGTKAAAGWSAVYDDATSGKRRAAFSNGNGCLEIITWNTYSIGLVMWDSITTPGSGRLYSDNFASVMSSGVNGWKIRNSPAPGSSGENIMGIYFPSLSSSYAANIDWTVFADSKSAWILFHYPAGSNLSEPGDYISFNSSFHSQIFIGALKSPDIARDQQGNFFVLYGGYGIDTGAYANLGSREYLIYCWGLRTPYNTIPNPGNNPIFDLVLTDIVSGNYITNPRGSVRLTLPILVTYNGNDVDKPAALSQTYAPYAFATVPGLSMFSNGGNGTPTSFWSYMNVDREASWNLEPYTIGGVTWMPWAIRSGYVNLAITDDSSWWA